MKQYCPDCYQVFTLPPPLDAAGMAASVWRNCGTACVTMCADAETGNPGTRTWFPWCCHAPLATQTNPVFFVRRAGLLWSQRDFEWWWSVRLFKCLTVLEFSFILFDLCLLITFFNFIMNYVPIVTFWIFTYHKIWILSIMFCFIWSYWIIYFLACL